MEYPDSRSIGAVKAKGVHRGEGHEAREPKPMPGGQIVSPTIGASARILERLTNFRNPICVTFAKRNS